MRSQLGLMISSQHPLNSALDLTGSNYHFGIGVPGGQGNVRCAWPRHSLQRHEAQEEVTL